MTTAIEKSDALDKLLEKQELYKFFSITDWTKRTLNNCQKIKRSGMLKTDEIEHQKKMRIKRQRHRMKDIDNFKISKEKLDLQENAEGIYVRMGRIEGSHPVLTPGDPLIAEKLIF